MLLSLKVEVVWKTTTSHSFNALAYGKLFQQAVNSIVAVGEDGVVRVYEVPPDHLSKHTNSTLKPIRSLETKCGPATHILLKDVTRLSPCDMLVSDTRGAVVLFCDGQILVRRCTFSGKTARVNALEVQESGFGHVQVIVGRDDGEVTCFNTFSQLWKIRLKDLSREHMKKTISVTSILSASITLSSGNLGDYVVISDTEGYLHVTNQGKVLSSIFVNAVIACMAAGRFLQLENANKQSKQAIQIALGCEDGTIWICVDFAVDKSSPYACVGHPITHLRRVPTRSNYVQSTSNTTGDSNVDLLVCGGHFLSLKILQHGKTIHSLALPSWPVSMCGLRDSLDSETRSRPSEDDNLVLVGCQDAVLQLVSIT